MSFYTTLDYLGGFYFHSLIVLEYIYNEHHLYSIYVHECDTFYFQYYFFM